MYFTGIVGLMNCIRQEHGCSSARYVFIQDEGVERFSLNAMLFADQLKKQLTANILKNGQWGSLRHLSLDQQNNTPSKLVEHAYIKPVISGDLSSTKWIESRLRYHCHEECESSNFCYVYYSPVNFRFGNITYFRCKFLTFFNGAIEIF